MYSTDFFLCVALMVRISDEGKAPYLKFLKISKKMEGEEGLPVLVNLDILAQLSNQ